MRVLVCHVRYRLAGGEDAVFETEVGILRRAGLDVATLDLASADVRRLPLRAQADVVLHYGDHGVGRRLVGEAIAAHRPEVVHFHNIYPQLGPGAIAEADALGCATVQTLHNYRLSCLAGTHLYRDAACELCRPGRYLPGVVRGCYRHCVLQSALACTGADSGPNRSPVPDQSDQAFRGFRSPPSERRRSGGVR